MQPETKAIATRSLEYRLAEKAFASALQLPDPYPSESRRGIIESIGEAYEAYGLSHGPKETMELARRIEAQAVVQAVKYRGRAK